MLQTRQKSVACIYVRNFENLKFEICFYLPEIPIENRLNNETHGITEFLFEAKRAQRI